MYDEEDWFEKKIEGRVVANDPNPQFFRELDNDITDYFAAQNGFLWSSDVSSISNCSHFRLIVFYFCI